MRRREFVTGALGALAVPRAFAQKSGKLYRIGFLGLASPTPELLKNSLDPFREAMRARGWVEGSNYAIEARWAHGKPERHAADARELVQLGVDVLMGLQGPQIRAAMDATRTIPIVMVAPPEPVQDGFIASYARPGGNVTGLSYEVDMSTFLKQLDFMRQTVKGLARLGWLVPESLARYSQENAQKLVAIAKDRGIDYRRYFVRVAEDLEPAFAKMKQDGMQAVTIRVDGMFVLNAGKVGALALKHGLPTSAQWQGYPRAGGLMSFGPDLADQYRRAADYVDRIFKGANPAEMAVERPTKFLFIVNLRTAKALGLVVPQSVLLQADEVIE